MSSVELHRDIVETILWWRDHAVTADIVWRALGRRGILFPDEWDRVYAALTEAAPR